MVYGGEGPLMGDHPRQPHRYWEDREEETRW